MYLEIREPRIVPCFVCKTFAYREDDRRASASLVICPTCGKFRFDDMADSIGGLPEFGKSAYKLSHYLRTVSERALGKRDNSYFPVYSAEDFKKILASPDTPVREKHHVLLRYMATLSRYPGDRILFDRKFDYSILGARNEGEALFFLNSLVEQQLLAAERLAGGENHHRLTSAGWQELEQMERSGGDSSNGFIAMKFQSSRDWAKDAIKTAISNAGYVPIRLDEMEHAKKIDDEIIARLRQSKFLVADLTDQSNGVYFEAGFMLGLGRPVIWLCEKSDVAKVRFDTQQYNTIEYSAAADLEKALQTRIQAMLGKGPHANEPTEL